MLIASGANVKPVATIMGHATIAITFDTYGHLLPDGEDEDEASCSPARRNVDLVLGTVR